MITGLGAVSPIGVGTPAYVAGLRANASGTRLLSATHPELDFSRCTSTVGAACVGFDADAVMSQADQKRLPRLVPMGLAAAQEAMAQSGLRFDEDERATVHAARGVGLALGSGAGGIDFTLAQARRAYDPACADGPSLWTITNATHGNLAGELSIRLGLRGPSMCCSDGCASASDALGLAMELLRSERPGSPEAMVVVGTDAHIQWETLHGMEMLRVISTRACTTPDEAAAASRPFDKERDGFVLGEGAWAVVVETAAHARRREARMIAEALGYGATCDAYHRVRPAPDMGESVRAIREAVDDAGLAMDDVEIVHYHGTGTELNDRLETAAIREAFGAHAERLVGHSVKGAIGHPQGACGLASLVATVGGLTNADGNAAGPFCVPTRNLGERDEACDLDYTAEGARDAAGRRVALINCLAFGAKNSALVVRAGWVS